MKRYKKFLSIFTIVCFLATIIPYNYVNADNLFDLKSESAILVDAGTGKIIYEKDPHKKLEPASITKIMVLLLAMESLESNRINLNDKVVVSENASSMGGSQVYLETGETKTVENLLKAISVRSANDAAVALSEHIAGSEELFIKMMNERAKALGMDNTNFMNPTGLPDDNHYTTAYDISIMSRELLKYPKIHQWLTIWMTTMMVGKENDVEQTLVNTNKLVRFYKGANGIKTGYTSTAGFCLSASATRNRLTLISVVLGCKTSNNRFSESRKLLDYGFATYDSLPICKKGDIIKNLPVSKGKIENIDVVAKKDLNLLIKKGKPKKIEKNYILPKYLMPPLSKNEKIGELVIKLEGKEVGRVDLIVTKDIEKASFFTMIKKMFSKLVSN
ncbi:MAG: D-alanyl-D-alanine carboxypeptidase [Firmicutes bacterium]|nr:D-alanyl-D-alanine carboxypeptidase [Bacillota bacterium]